MGIQLLWHLPDWEAESYPEILDLVLMLPIFAVIFPILRLVLDNSVFHILAWRLVPCNNQLRKEQFQQTVSKFKESAWKFVYFFSAETFAILVTYDEPWLLNTKAFWIGPGQQVWPDQKTKFKLKVLYAFSGGFYAYSMLALVFWETRRKDFGVSMSHHVATFLLIIGSYPLRFARIGSVVLALHDASDIFLEFAKMSNYAGSNILPSIFFVLFAVSWIMLRLIYYPFWVIWSTSYEVVQTLDRAKNRGHGPVIYYAFNTFLISLLVLHIYWWILIYRMILRQIQAKGKIEKDVRSDSDSDDD